jgi:hypothetical protein
VAEPELELIPEHFPLRYLSLPAGDLFWSRGLEQFKGRRAENIKNQSSRDIQKSIKIR